MQQHQSNNGGATLGVTTGGGVTAGGSVVGGGASGGAGGAPGSAATPFASASLYVGDLSPDVPEALLFEIFSAVGPVASVRVCRDAATRRSLGYAYVNFHRGEDAERALDTMNFKNIKSRPCRIMWSHRDPSLRKSGSGNVFVNHLDKSIDNKSLYDTFSLFGNILSCKVATNAKRESLGYGFVHFENDESAQKAIQRVDGKIIAGQRVAVQLFKSKKDRGGLSRTRFTNVYVKNLPTGWDREKLQEVFGHYGTINSLAFPEPSASADGKDSKDAPSKPKGYAFVNFQEPEEAAAAVAGLHEAEYEGKKLYVSRAQKKEERERELRDQFDQLKTDRQRKYAGVNLYVKNLADDVDDEKLRAIFAPYGSISSAKVMRDAANKSKGFGFVCFSTPDEATKAVSDLNGKMTDSKPLYVSLAQRKDTRRAHLEQQHLQRVRAQATGQYQQGGQQMGPMGGGGQPMYAPQAPMFYQGPGGMGRGGGMMGYNGGPPRPRWNPQQPGPHGPMMDGRGGMGMGYQLMPVGGGGRGGPAPRGRGGRGGGRGGMDGGMGRGGVNNLGGRGGANGGAPNPNVRYGDNVRNRNQSQEAPTNGSSSASSSSSPSSAASEAVVSGGSGAGAGGAASATEPLTIKALATAPEEMRKQMIGERLYPLIEAQEPEQAGKITGMLLEMDTPELIHLLESPAALSEKIAEALHVLQEADE